MAEAQLTGSFLFAVALSAPMAAQGRDDCSHLRSRRSPADLRDELARRWNVRHQGDFSRVIEWLESGGDSAAFAREMHAIGQRRATTVEAVQQAIPGITPAKAAFLLQHGGEAKNERLLAWDLARCANLVRWGCNLGWLTQFQAWEILSRNARRAQDAFKSWREFARQFALGWRYVDGGRPLPAGAAAAIQQLLEDPASPWRQVAWNVPLNFAGKRSPSAPAVDCVRCDQKLSANVRFCPQCGLKLQTRTAARGWSRRKFLAVAAIAVVCFFSMAAILALTVRSHSESTVIDPSGNDSSSTASPADPSQSPNGSNVQSPAQYPSQTPPSVPGSDASGGDSSNAAPTYPAPTYPPPSVPAPAYPPSIYYPQSAYGQPHVYYVPRQYPSSPPPVYVAPNQWPGYGNPRDNGDRRDGAGGYGNQRGGGW
jgi:hypothetical protein